MSSQFPQPGHQDRRRTPRVETNLEGRLHGQEEGTCRVLNISSSGALAVVSRPLPEMAQVRVRIAFDVPGEGETHFTCEAAVVRCDRRPDGLYDAGLFFTLVPDESRAVLQRLLETRTLHPA